MLAAGIVLIIGFVVVIAVLAHLAERTLPRGKVFVRRGREERNAMSRIVEKHSRWSGGSGGGSGA